MRKQMLSAFVILIIALIAPLGAYEKHKTGKAPEPVSMGPFPVGVTTTVFIDKSRTDDLTKQPRTLVTEI